ncbi:MAG: RNHCP domain-containing protein [Dehalococcoidia bacterium]
MTRDGGGTFRCVNCKQQVDELAFGTQHRNHCPLCLWSKHVDNFPGDRKSDCHGRMEPIAITLKDGGEWAVIHRCKSCDHLKDNRIAGDDNTMVLMAIAARPLANPPIPMDYLRS